MKKVDTTRKIPIKMWLDDVEENAMEQARNMAELPFAFKHIALMADSHFGYGIPIGGILATRQVVVPNAVGVDIGCGMCAVRTSRKSISKDELKAIMGDIRDAVPVGFKHQKHKQDETLMPSMPSLTSTEFEDERPIISQEYNSALKQLGTLGGGMNDCLRAA